MALRTPPPVADLYPQKPVDAMLITPGSKSKSDLNRLVLAWPTSRPSESSMPSGCRGEGDSSMFLPIAERSKTHAGLVVSPSGKTLLKLESSYQGYFTPKGQNYSTLIRNDGLKYTDYHNRSHVYPGDDDRRIGSFITLNDSGIGKEKHDRRDIRLASPGQFPVPGQEDKMVRFRVGREIGQSTNRDGGSPPRENSFSGDSLNSSGSHPNLSSSNLSEKISLQNENGSHGGKSCQMFCCWLLMTLIVILILSLCFLFIVTNYQRSTAAPDDEVTLRQHLERYLIGQEIAIDELSSFFDMFLSPVGAPVPLVVISLHGGVGVGKSFTNQLISNYYFSESDISSCVSIFSVPFYNPWPSESIRAKLDDWLAVRNTGCPFQFHILDDLGSDTPCSLLSVIEKSLNEFHSKKSNYKHLIVMVTDVASVSIRQIVQEHIETNREKELNIHQFKYTIERSWSAIDRYRQQYTRPEGETENSCNFANLSKFVNVSIPFVPLQRHHVKQCALNMSKRQSQHVPSDQVEWVADQVIYEPQSWPIFASSGCKTVSEKLNLVFNVGKV